MSLNLKIRRYHLVLIACAAISLLSAIAIFSREQAPSLRDELPPMEEVVPPAALQPRPEPPKPKVRVKTPKSVVVAPTLGIEPKTIALTFDDGPHPQFTERLLTVLEENDVPATFFVVGKQVERYPELAQKIFQKGHELANHTFTHRNMRTLSEEEINRELDRTEELVRGITDQKMHFFRPPGGQYDDHVVRAASDLGYTMALWTVFPQDHSNPPAELIRNRVMHAASNRGVVLLHSGVENTLSVLPEIIQRLRDRGYRFVTLSHMQSGRTVNGGQPPFVRLAQSEP